MTAWLVPEQAAGWPLLTYSFTCAWTWALLTPVVLWVSSRVHTGREHWPRIVALHVLGAVCFALVAGLIALNLAPWLPAPSAVPGTRPMLVGIEGSMLAYLVIVAIAEATRSSGQSRERQQESAHLATQLARAELQVLKMQLQPHFLFNALNAISELIHQDPGTADRLVARLGHLLRLSLDQAAGHQMVPLRQELEFLRAYLEIEQTRYGKRLAVEIVAGLEVLDAAVPTLLLQPLVENAIGHGAAARSGGGVVSLRARRDDDRLRLVIEDNGPGFPESHPILRPGLGLRNTRERLRQLYGEDHRFKLANATEGGARVVLEVPFREISQANTPLHLRAVTPVPVR
jgi:signal transduction histidine kinase